jgi:hypothetical protein
MHVVNIVAKVNNALVLILVIAAYLLPYWAQLWNWQSGSGQEAVNMVAGHGLFYGWIVINKNTQGALNVANSNAFMDWMQQFAYFDVPGVEGISIATPVDIPLWVCVVFGFLTIILSVAVAMTECTSALTGSKTHKIVAAVLLVCSLIPWTVYFGSNSFKNSKLRSCASSTAYINDVAASFSFNSSLCSDKGTGWVIQYDSPNSAATNSSAIQLIVGGLATGPSVICSALVSFFAALGLGLAHKQAAYVDAPTTVKTITATEG